jgi:hypothetical protein
MKANYNNQRWQEFSSSKLANKFSPMATIFELLKDLAEKK